jgi:hypothetical protein
VRNRLCTSRRNVLFTQVSAITQPVTQNCTHAIDRHEVPDASAVSVWSDVCCRRLWHAARSNDHGRSRGALRDGARFANDRTGFVMKGKSSGNPLLDQRATDDIRIDKIFITCPPGDLAQ